MPLYAVDIEKRLNTETWTNRYIVDQEDMEAAVVASNLIVSCEAQVHMNIVTIERHRVSTLIAGDEDYSIIADGIAGNREAGDYLPLFNVVRVDFTAIGGGRPSRKYLRVPINEIDVTNGQLSGALRSAFQASYVAPLLAPSIGFVDVDGQPFSSGVVQAQVGMRQLRRGSKRKLKPVLG